MSLTRNQFIQDNQEILQTYSAKMTDKFSHVLGFGCNSPLRSFKAVLKDGDEFKLPLCFLYLLWDFPDQKTQNFVLDSLESLYEINDKGKVTDPVMAYVYAYCLCLNDEDDKSYDILRILGSECFPPALASIGDGAVAHSEIALALDWYKHAIDHGHLAMKGIYNKLICENLSFPKNLPFGLYAFFNRFPNAIKLVNRKGGIEKSLYLDFYKIGHHLNEYWNKPKVDRIQSFKDQSIILRKEMNV